MLASSTPPTSLFQGDHASALLDHMGADYVVRTDALGDGVLGWLVGSQDEALRNDVKVLGYENQPGVFACLG